MMKTMCIALGHFMDTVFYSSWQLLRLLIGVAWIDGELHPNERAYLEKLIQREGLQGDSSLGALLDQPVSQAECYQWLSDYLTNNPSPAQFQRLLLEMSTLFHFDAHIDASEQGLLDLMGQLQHEETEFQRRLMQILLDGKFLANIYQGVTPEKNKGNGIYAKVPYLILNQLSSALSKPAVKTEMAKLYLTDNFAPVSQEVTVAELPVIGELPSDLQGLFVRVGPNPQFPPIGTYHWFDGDGMVHGMYLSKGKASYRNRYVRTQGFLLEQQEGKAIWPGVMNLPRFDSPHGLMLKNAANTALIWHRQKLLALWEAGEPHWLSTPDLATVGVYSFEGQFSGAFTAHPKVDPETGEMLFISFSPIAPPYLSYGIVSAAGEVTVKPIQLPGPKMCHDFAITAHYTLILDLALNFKPANLLKGEHPMVYDGQQTCRIGILPRHGNPDSLQWFTISPCVVFHTANAYEEGEEIILHGIRATSIDGLLEVGQGNPDQEPGTNYCLWEWRCNLSTGVVREICLDTQMVEFPRINEAYMGRPYRYLYAATGATYISRPLFDGVVKYDLDQGSHTTYFLGRGRFAGEWVFAPHPEAQSEDHGWLLTYVWDTLERRSELVILDAQNIAGGPVARVLSPQRIPYGFHGIWIPRSDLKS